MGNSASIFIETESNGPVCGGMKLKGKVLLDVRKETSADSLIFRFYGHEKTKVEYSAGSDNYKANGTANIYSTEVVMHRFAGGSVTKGRYLFPFEVALPRGLPGSQSFNASGNSCSVSYHCEAKLLQPGKLLGYAVKNSCDVLMADDQLVYFPTPMFLGPTSCKVFFMSINSCGTISFGGKVNATSVWSNGNLLLDYGIFNQSTAHVKALDIVVTCYISFKAKGHSYNTSCAVFERRIDASKLVGAQPLKNKKDGAVDSDYVAVLEQIKEHSELTVNIPIVSDILPSYSGALMIVRYVLSLSVKTTFGTNNDSISIPIIMQRSVYGFAGVVPKVEGCPDRSNAIEASTVLLSEPSVLLDEGYDTVGSLCAMVLQSSAWQETSVLRDWLAHSPNNINLLTPDTMPPLFQLIKGSNSFYTFCQVLGLTMNDTKSTNICTTAHIAEAARTILPPMNINICNLFSPYCTDRMNARDAFRAIGLTDMETAGVMVHYT